MRELPPDCCSEIVLDGFDQGHPAADRRGLSVSGSRTCSIPTWLSTACSGCREAASQPGVQLAARQPSPAAGPRSHFVWDADTGRWERKQ
jgi:hypothetical protein